MLLTACTVVRSIDSTFLSEYGTRLPTAELFSPSMYVPMSRSRDDPCHLSLATTSSSSSFDALCTGVCNRELSLLNDNPTVQEGDLLIGIRCSAGALNTQGYLQLKDLFQKKNVHLNDLLPYRNESGEEKSFFSLLLQKSATLPSALVATITELISNRTVRVIRYLKDVGLARTIESLLGSSVGKLSAELNGQQWPTMPPIFTWIYQHVSAFSLTSVRRLRMTCRVATVKMRCSTISIVASIIYSLWIIRNHPARRSSLS